MAASIRWRTDARHPPKDVFPTLTPIDKTPARYRGTACAIHVPSSPPLPIPAFLPSADIRYSGRQRGSIAAVDHTIKAEGVDHVVDVGFEIFFVHALWSASVTSPETLQQTLGNCASVLISRFHGSKIYRLANVGLADAIEDKLHAGTLRHQLDRVRHLNVRDADVKAQPIVRQCLHALDKVGA